MSDRYDGMTNMRVSREAATLAKAAAALADKSLLEYVNSLLTECGRRDLSRFQERQTRSVTRSSS